MKNIFGLDSQKKEVEKAKDNKANMKSCGSRDEISKLAYQFFVDRGGAHGHDQDDWYRAEQIVKQKRGER